MLQVKKSKKDLVCHNPEEPNKWINILKKKDGGRGDVTNLNCYLLIGINF